MTYTGSVPASIVALPPRETGVPLSVMLELVKDALPILDKVLFAPLIVLFVRVSVVALPTKVSVAVGKVTVPVLEMLEITGAVKVLLVKVWLPVSVATVESIAIVPVVVIVPPLNPVPAVILDTVPVLAATH
jgi:hypothetical protein